MNRSWRLSPLLVSLATLATPLSAADAGAPPPDLPPPPAPVIIAGPGTARLRIEALDDGIVRLWYKAAGDFTRPPSLATAMAPTTRVPLALKDAGGTAEVSTGTLTVRVDRATLGFDVIDRRDGTPLIAHGRIAPAATGRGWSVMQQIAPEEKLLGLGQDNENAGRLDRRGTIRDLWAGQRIKSPNVTAQYPVPFLLSTGPRRHAYGEYYDNTHELRFDLAKTDPNEVRCDAPGGDLDLYVIDGPSPAEVVERDTRLTGRPSLPPLWALGYWQSKCTFRDWNEIDETYGQLTSRGFPVDVLVIDADWPKIQNDYVWAKRWFGPGYTPAQKIAEYAKRGVRIVMSQSGPMIRPDSPTFASGWQAGVFATDGHGHPVECGYYGGDLLDFTNPRLNDWLWPQARKLNEDGVAGWWLDLTEPEGEPPQTVYYGGDRADVHNEFSLLCTRSYVGVQLAVHPDQRPFILTRCGPAGLQRFHAAVWTGDITSDYGTLRSHPPEMLNSGLSGLAWWTCDTGGFLEGYYRNDQFGAHAGLYTRWMEFSVFSPIVRAHKAGGAPQPYAFGPATEQATRHYLRLRYRLLPYIYSYAWQASTTGLPLVRPLGFEFPDDPGSRDAPGDEYLFGQNLLVAPVLHEGVTNRRVYFPPGKWYDWDTGVEYDGGRSWVVAAPLNRIPVAVRAGAIIPLAPFMSNTAEKPWDPLTLEVYPAGHSDFVLYRDDGISFAYRQRDYTTSRFDCEARARSVQFKIAESNKRYTPHVYRVRFHLRQTPTAVSADGAALVPAAGAAPTAGQWTWDAGQRVLTVVIDDTDTAHTLAVSLDGADLPARPAPALVADVPDDRGDAASARPRPHIYPPPALPIRVKAVNYDNGGEGLAFHCTPPAPAPTHYRLDDIGCVECDDAGGGFALAGLQPDDWARYTVDAGNGGYFDLAARLEGAGRFRLVVDGQTISTVDAAPGVAGWHDVRSPNVYLNPGESGLVLYVERAGFVLNTLEFQPAADPPRTYDAALARRAGTTELRDLGGGFDGHGTLGGLGRTGSSATFGLRGLTGANATVRLFFRNGQGKRVVLSFALDGAPEQKFSLAAAAGDAWQAFDLPAPLPPGTHRLVLRGQEGGWDAVELDHLEVLTR